MVIAPDDIAGLVDGAGASKRRERWKLAPRRSAGQVKSPAELRASIGMTEDAWNALPDARDR